MRVAPPDVSPRTKVHYLPVRPRPDELLDDGARDVQPVSFGSLALQVQAREDREATDAAPDLLWPPVLCDERPRGRPTRQEALWRRIATRTRAEARAYLAIMQDLCTHAEYRLVTLPGRGTGHVIERSARYYSRDGDIPHELAKHVLQRLLLDLRASRVLLMDLINTNVPIRKTKGRRHAPHWFLTRSAVTDLKVLIGLLHAHGIRRPPSSRPLRALAKDPIKLDVRVKGSRWWAVCPLHGDRDPSLLLNACGSAWCFGGCGGVGRWVDAHQNPLDPGRTPDRVLLYAFVDAEASLDRRRSEDRASAQDGPNPTHRSTPTAYSLPVGIGEVDAEVSDLALRRYAPSRAARAGRPGVHPVQKYLGHYNGRRDCVVRMPTTQKSIRYVGERRSQARAGAQIRPYGLVLGKRTSCGMGRSYASNFDLIEVMRKTDQRSKTPRATQIAQDHYERARAEHARRRFKGNIQTDNLPDLFVSLDHQSHRILRDGTSMTDRYLPEKPEFELPAAYIQTEFPDGFEPVATVWVGVDIDKLRIPLTAVASVYGEDEQDARALVDQRGGPGCVGDEMLRKAATEAIQAWLEAQPEFTGRFAMVRTGPSGVQVVAELEHARWSPEGLWDDPDFRAQAENLGKVVLGALRVNGCTGGTLDTSSFAAGRYVRRPGWRIAKDGHLFRSRLVFCTP